MVRPVPGSPPSRARAASSRASGEEMLASVPRAAAAAGAVGRWLWRWRWGPHHAICPADGPPARTVRPRGRTARSICQRRRCGGRSRTSSASPLPPSVASSSRRRPAAATDLRATQTAARARPGTSRCASRPRRAGPCTYIKRGGSTRRGSTRHNQSDTCTSMQAKRTPCRCASFTSVAG